MYVCVCISVYVYMYVYICVCVLLPAPFHNVYSVAFKTYTKLICPPPYKHTHTQISHNSSIGDKGVHSLFAFLLEKSDISVSDI